MNPPNTAQIVKTRLLDKVFPSESLLSLSVTLGILNLNILQENEYCQALVQSPKSKPKGLALGLTLESHGTPPHGQRRLGLQGGLQGGLQSGH